MTYLKGETTWGELINKIIDLATGAVADDQGVTTAAADRWRRPVAGVNVLASPASQDQVVVQQHRAGYWLRVDDACIGAGSELKADATNQWCRQTGIWTGWSANHAEHYQVMLRVQVANTVAGDYSNAQVHLRSVADNNSSTGANQPTVTLDAQGNGTFTANGFSMTFQLGDPSGILKVGTVYVRHFSSEFRGGFDYWRGYAKSPEKNATFDIAPPGVDGTDYERTGDRGKIVSWFNHSAYQLFPTASAPTTTTYNSWNMGVITGLGIKTDAALTGDRYVVRFSTTHAIGYLDTLTTGQVRFRWGGTGLSPSGARHYGLDGARAGSTIFMRPFNGTPVATSRVQYWITVTDKHLAIALNGDTVNGGVLTHSMIARVEVDDPAQDAGCWYMGFVGSSGNASEWVRLGAAYVVERLSNNGWAEGTRDWQTGYGRMDFLFLGSGGWHYGHFGFCLFDYGSDAGLYPCTILQTTYGNSPQSISSDIIAVSTTRDQTRNVFPPEWELAGSILMDYPRTSSSSNYAIGLPVPRGYVARGLWRTATGGWVSGDELSDSTTGKKYTLFGSNQFCGSIASPAGVAMEQI
jgi:hypothetical protein